MFKKFTEQEIRTSIIPFNHLFMSNEQFEEFKMKSVEHKSSEDYTVICTPLPAMGWGLHPPRAPLEDVKKPEEEIIKPTSI